MANYIKHYSLYFCSLSIYHLFIYLKRTNREAKYMNVHNYIISALKIVRI